MKKRVLSLILTLAMAASFVGFIPTATAAAGDYDPTTDGWRLTWHDEFDGPAVDETKWGWDTGGTGWGNREIQYFQRDNTSLRDGNLVIAALPTDPRTQGGWTTTYSSSRIKTQGKFSQMFGRVEARMRLPEGEGYWPVFWMMPDTSTAYGGWPTGGEVDIMEARGRLLHNTSGAVHFGNPHDYTLTNYPMPDSDITEYHIYAFEWEPGEMRWYRDGVLYKTAYPDEWFSKATNMPVKYASPAPFDQPFYVMLSLAVGGTFDNEIVPGQYGGPEEGEMIVDYVRVYAKDLEDYKPTPYEAPFVDYDVVKSPIGSGSSAEYLYNRTFDWGDSTRMTYWHFDAPGTAATASVSWPAKKLEVNIASNTGRKDVKLYQKGVRLVANSRYAIAFDAVVDKERMVVPVFKDSTGAEIYADYVTLVPGTTRYTARLGSLISDNNGTFELQMGGAAGAITIDNFSLRATANAYIDPNPDPTIPDPTGWEMVWNDEFEETALDPTKWDWQNGTENNGWGNREIQYYNPANTSFRDGHLVITAKPDETRTTGGYTTTYSSSKIRTYGKFSQAFGRFEARISLPEGEGFWPAFRMMPEADTYGAWPRSGEIDIMEAKGRFPLSATGAVRFGQPNQSLLTDFAFPESDDNMNFHVYAVEWEPGQMRWYVDDVLYKTVDSTEWYSQTTGTVGSGGMPVKYANPAPFDEPFHMVLSLAAGGTFDQIEGVNVVPGQLGGPTTGEMVVDYVRVYAKDMEDYMQAPYEAPSINYDANKSAQGSGANAEYLYNRTFDWGDSTRMTYWHFDAPSTAATASVSWPAKKLEINIASDTALEDVKLYQKGTRLVQFGLYTLGFDAVVDTERTVKYLLRNAAGEEIYSDSVTLVPGTTRYTGKLGSLISVTGGTFELQMGGAAGAITLDNFSLKVTANAYYDWEPKQATARYANVTIPTGSDWAIDSVWDQAEVYEISPVAADSASAKFRVLWDENSLYLLAEVSDKVLNASNTLTWSQDSIEAYVSETNARQEYFVTGDYQYRLNYLNVATSDNNAKPRASAAKITEIGYTLMMAIPFTVITPQEGTVIGFSINVNDCSNGTRNYAIEWCNSYSSAHISTKFYGEMTLVKDEEEPNVDVTSAVGTIVAGYAANLPADVTFAGDPASFGLGLYDPSGKLLSTIDVSANGKYTFKLAAADAVEGLYTIKAIGAAEGASINCVAQPIDLWVPKVTIADENTVITFAADVTFNASKKGVKIGEVPVDNNKVSVSGKVVTIAGVTTAQGQQLVISGVKYAELFPSYSFTFTIFAP